MNLPVPHTHQIAVALLLINISSISSAQVDASVCGDIGKPQWDYRYATQAQHNEVEGAHFVPVVENLIRGNRGYLGGDLAYTLRASPNHHRALISVTRWSEKLKVLQLPDMPLPVECYFERGIRYKADDHMVRLLYAQFLIGKARPAEATQQLEQVARMVGENGFTLYNIGLIYTELKDYGQALAYAHKSMTLGFFKPELRQRLEKAGNWVEPPDSGDEPASSNMPAAASSSTPGKS